VDSSVVSALVSFNLRRAMVRFLDLFTQRMRELELNPIEFSLLSLIGHNPGVTPSHLRVELDLLAPNLAKLLAGLDQRKLLVRTVPARDRRAACLSLSPAGLALLARAQQEVLALEAHATATMTAKQRETLISMLRKINP
jgi:DNA-binding MarR family transcriptional regulator